MDDLRVTIEKHTAEHLEEVKVALRRFLRKLRLSNLRLRLSKQSMTRSGTINSVFTQCNQCLNQIGLRRDAKDFTQNSLHKDDVFQISFQ